MAIDAEEISMNSVDQLAMVKYSLDFFFYPTLYPN